jgi:ribonuclease T1
VFWTGLAPSGFRTLALTAGLVLGSVLAVSQPAPVAAREASPAASSSVPVVGLGQLPVQAQEAHQRILAGGPFPYPKDGIVFGNRERLLPSQARGFYREYTVKTPGAKDRGARRIVCGGDPPIKPEVCFYTDDHYASYRRISP